MRRWIGRLGVYGAGAAGIFAYAWWATGRRPFTAGATLAVVGSGLAAMAIGHTRRPRHDTRPARAGAIGWLLLLVALAGWQLLAYIQEPRSEHPTVSSLTNAALDTHAGRAVAFVGWLVGGAHMARR